MTLSQSIGDSVTHRIPLRWRGRAFVPAVGSALVFTVKVSPEDEDEAALFQKSYPGGNITFTASTAAVETVPQDTEALTEGTYVWDIKASNNDGDRQTVASGSFVLLRTVSREVAPVLDVHTVAPPLLFFSYQNYLATTDDDPVLTEEQWVSRLGTSNPQIVSVSPPLPPDYPMPYEGLEWFDPSDGSTSVWMWKQEGVMDTVDDGFFLSQFPTPPATGIPDKSFVDDAGKAYVDDAGKYYIYV